MSEQIKHGGPAFPEVFTTADTVGSSGEYQTYSNVQSSGGMTLRDYFAAKAMQSLIVTLAQVAMKTGEVFTHKECGVLAYRYADAMLAARGDA